MQTHLFVNNKSWKNWSLNFIDWLIDWLADWFLVSMWSMYVFMWMCVHICENQRSTLGAFLRLLTTIFEFSHWPWNSLILIEQLANELWGSASLCPPPHHHHTADIRQMLSCAWPYTELSTLFWFNCLSCI